MSRQVIVTDECLWFKHLNEPDMAIVLRSLCPGSRVWLKVDGTPILFERMATGRNKDATQGMKPVGASAAAWRDYYMSRKGEGVSIDFLGSFFD